MSRRRPKSASSVCPSASLPTIGVSLRVRPPELRARKPASPCCKGEFGEFEVDFVHEDSATQEDVYQETFRPIVNAFLQGVGGYGGGREGSIPRAVGAIFRHLAMVPEERFKLYASYSALTIGHEALLVDLLAPGSNVQSLRDTSSPAALSKLSDLAIQCPDDIYEVLRRGRVSRAMGLSGCACVDSRSVASLGPGTAHTMLTLQLENRGCCKTSPRKTGSYISRVTFVELAAPEGKDPCDTCDVRDTRSLAIASSALTGVLLGLGKTGSSASKFADASSKFSHIPWRDSPLTRWLKESLLQSSLIWVVATVSSAQDDAGDTLATLNYVSRLRSSGKNEGIIVTPRWETRCHTSWHAASLESSERLTFLPKNNLAVAMLSGAHSAMGADTAAYSELLAIIKRNGGGLRAEALLEKLMQEIGELRGYLAAEQSESKRLKANVQSLASERHMEEKEKEATRHALNSVKEELVNAQMSLDEMRSRKEESQRESSERQLKINQLVRENDTLHVAKDDLAQKLHVQIHELSEEAQRLKTKASEAAKKAQTEKSIRKTQAAELKRLEDKACEADRLRDECHDFRRALEATRQERIRLQDDKWEVDEKIEKLTVDLEAARMALDRAESNSQNLKARVEGLEEDIRSSRARNDILRSDIATYELELVTYKHRTSDLEAIQSAMDEVKCLMAEMEVQAGRHGCLPEFRPSTEHENNTQEDEDPNVDTNGFAPIQKWRRNLTALVECLENVETENSGNQARCEETMRRCIKSEEVGAQLNTHQKILEEQLSASRALCESMRQDVEALRSAERLNVLEIKTKDEAISGLRADRESLANQLRDLQEKGASLSGQCERLQAETADLAIVEQGLRRSNGDLKGELDDVQKRMDWTQSTLNEEHQKVLRLQQEIDLLERSEEEKRGQISSGREERNRLEEEVRTGRDALTKLTRAKADSDAELENAKRKLERIEEKLFNAENNVKLVTEKIDTMAADGAREEARLRSDIEILKSQKGELEIRSSELSKETAELRLTIEELEDDKRRMRKTINENSANQESIKYLREELAQFVAERDQYQQQAASLKDEIKSLTAANTRFSRENDEQNHTVTSLKRQIEQSRLDSMVLAAKQARTQESLRQQRRENMLHRTLTARPEPSTLSTRPSTAAELLGRSSRKWSTNFDSLHSEISTPPRAVSEIVELFKPSAALGDGDAKSPDDLIPAVSRVSSTASEILAEIGEKLKP
ncbi:hypothetical protein BSKO_01924 [Bryopsis sp. KO-2023]|nr:hypothetical protein BSKO_01924 [Bryopsis sp. KO-2023]